MNITNIEREIYTTPYIEIKKINTINLPKQKEMPTIQELYQQNMIKEYTQQIKKEQTELTPKEYTQINPETTIQRIITKPKLGDFYLN